MIKSEITKKIKSLVKKDFPDSSILLYGSRARSDFSQDSDWDFLILVDKTLNEYEKIALKNKLYDIELESDQVINSVIHSTIEWNRPEMRVTPFYKNVIKEGIAV